MLEYGDRQVLKGDRFLKRGSASVVLPHHAAIFIINIINTATGNAVFSDALAMRPF